MFEKEAEEYTKQFIKTHSESDKFINCKRETDNYNVILAQGYELGFQKGAEFGYNKANEWHYVKDELPPIKKKYNGRSELVLVLSKEKEMQYAQYVEEAKTWARGIFEISFVPYAWKEIVLPKENK